MFSASTLLSSATTLLFRVIGTFEYSCFVLQARLFSVSTLLFSTIPYLWVPIVRRPSHSLLLVYADKHIYDKYLNNEP